MMISAPAHGCAGRLSRSVSREEARLEKKKGRYADRDAVSPLSPHQAAMI